MNVVASATCNILPVLVTPAQFIRAAAIPHAGTLSLWPHREFLEFADTALRTVRTLRSTFFEQGDLVWQAEAAEGLKSNGLDFESVLAKLIENRVVDALTHR